MTRGASRLTLRVAVAGALLALLTGCPGTSEPSGTLPPTPSATPSTARPTPSPSLTDEQQILAQYKRFWLETLPAAFAAPANRREAVLRPVVTGRELTVLLNNMGAADDRGEVGYGKNLPLQQVVTAVTGDLALTTGCLDSSKAGFADRRTGEARTVGPGRNAVQVNLLRGPDQLWRVSAVVYPEGTRC